MKLALPILALLAFLSLPVAAADVAGEPAVSQAPLRHVVAFKFKETASADEIQEVLSEFKALPKKIPQIQSFEAGTNVSPEGLAKDFTHCWILTFKTVQDRDAYLVHPAHKAFGGIVGPAIADVFVIDFWAHP